MNEDNNSAMVQAEVNFGSKENVLMTVCIPLSEAYKIVFDDLIQHDLFKGIHDAKHGNNNFMYGIATVMECIAHGVSEECLEKFNKEFTQNMIASVEKT